MTRQHRLVRDTLSPGMTVRHLACGPHPLYQQAAQRGQKAAVMTQPDPEDPLKDKYGDYPMVQVGGATERPSRPSRGGVKGWGRTLRAQPAVTGDQLQGSFSLSHRSARVCSSKQ